MNKSFLSFAIAFSFPVFAPAMDIAVSAPATEAPTTTDDQGNIYKFKEGLKGLSKEKDGKLHITEESFTRALRRYTSSANNGQKLAMLHTLNTEFTIDNPIIYIYRLSVFMVPYLLL